VKLTVKPHVLRYLLDKANMAVAVRAGDVILTTFHVCAAPGSLRVSATDLRVGLVTGTAMVEVDEAFTFCAPAKKFAKIVSAVPDDTDVVIELQAGLKLRIQAGQAVWNTSVFDAKDFPDVPLFDAEAVRHVVSREGLLAALDKVRFAVSDDTQRPMLQQVYFDGKAVYASDSYRLQVAEYPYLAGVSIPSLALADLMTLLKRSEAAEISVSVDKNHILFGIGSDIFSCTVMQAKFPDVRKLILQPAMGNKDEVVATTQALVAAVNRVAIVADQGSKAMSLKLEKRGELFGISLHTSDQLGDQGSEFVEATYDTKLLGKELWLNYQYLLEMLGALNGKLVTFRLGEDTPIHLSSIYVTEPGLEAVCLQFRP
jgi:DNA polymerase III beta subunit